MADGRDDRYVPKRGCGHAIDQAGEPVGSAKASR